MAIDNWHLFSTPFIPYSHKCVLDGTQGKSQTCWNCRTYLNSLWPYGRVESRSLDKQAARQYCAKYLAKSFHLKNLYQEHGWQDHQRTYHFYQNLYDYEEKEVLLINQSKLDAQTGNFLNGNQKVFRKFDYETQATSYFYRTNKTLTGKCQKPVLIKKNYRLGTRTLNTLSLLKLTKKSKKKESLKLRKSQLKKPTLNCDFQELIIANFLLLCKTAEFTHAPLEQEKVPKEAEQCNGLIYTHFQAKPILRFTFAPEQAATVREFIDKLDDYAEEYEMEESKNFTFYPSKYARSTWTPAQARNQYLDNWQWDYCRDNYNPFRDIWRMKV